MDTERIEQLLHDLEFIKRKIIEESRQYWHEATAMEWVRQGIIISKLLKKEFESIVKPKKLTVMAQLYKNGVDLPL